MINEYFKTLSKVIRMRTIIGYNGMVYALKMIPVIGKIIPDSLYSTAALKAFYWLIHVIKELLMLFLGKIAGLGMIYIVSYLISREIISQNLYEGMSGTYIYGTFAVFLFMVYAVCGILIRVPVYNCNTEKKYLVFMIRLNAKKLDDTLFIYDLSKLFAGYLITGVVAGFSGCPAVVWLGIPFLAVLIKMFGAGGLTRLYKSKSRRHKPMRLGNVSIFIRLAIAMCMLPVTLVMIIIGLVLPLWIILPSASVFVLLGIWGCREYFLFDAVNHRRALNDNITDILTLRSRNLDTTKQFKKIKANGSVNSDKKGFDYLNALFVKRHRKMLFAKPVVMTVLIIGLMAFIIYVFISYYHEDHGTQNTKNMIINNLINFITLKGYDDVLSPLSKDSPFMFFRYLVKNHLLAMIIPIYMSDATFKATQAMYINCDNSLMTFSFFKQRTKIMKLFDIRLKQIIKINLPPVIAMGIASVIVLFYTGGEDYPLHYLVTMSVPFFLSVLVSLSWLALYYLFQPFTTTVNVMSGSYTVANIIITTGSALILWIPLNSLILAPVLLVVAGASIVVVRKLVFKMAPKTWRIKS